MEDDYANLDQRIFCEQAMDNYAGTQSLVITLLNSVGRRIRANGDTTAKDVSCITGIRIVI